MDRLERDLRRELGRLGSPDAGDIAAIVEAWPELVGDTVARNAWPLRLGRDGALRVATTSSTWAFELGRLAPELEERLRARLGAAAPASLRFAPGPVPEPATAPAQQRPRPLEPSAEDRDEAAALTSRIDDENLRKLLARAAAASLARARSGRSF